MRSLFALLVGIDDYPRPLRALKGAVNDARAVAAYLQSHTPSAQFDTPRIDLLEDGQATRQAIVDRFRKHLGQAGPGDVALFYFAGHGSQQQAPQAFWPIEPDRLNETLVCFDSRAPGGFDLADKELALLIAELASNGAHVVVILDSCHSGSGTRNPAIPSTVARRAPADARERPASCFLEGAESMARGEPERPSQAAGFSVTGSGWPRGRHVLLAACRDDQLASEAPTALGVRGIFTHALLETLNSAVVPLTYSELQNRVSARVRSRIGSQSPQLETLEAELRDSRFLDGALCSSIACYPVAFVDPNWVLFAGAIQGVGHGGASGSGAEVSLFPANAAAADLVEPARRLGTARVAAVEPSRCLLQMLEPFQPSPADTFQATIVRSPADRLIVAIDGRSLVLTVLREAVERDEPPYPFRLGRGSEVPALLVEERDHTIWLRRPADDRPLVRPLPIDGGLSADWLLGAVGKVAHWLQVAGLQNDATRLTARDVGLSIRQGGRLLRGTEIQHAYQHANGQWLEPTLSVSVVNRGLRTLYVALLDLAQDFEIALPYQPAGCQAVLAGMTFELNQGDPIPFCIPDDQLDRGVTDYRDLLKLIVSTEEFDATSLCQPAIGDMAPAEPVRSAGRARGSALDRLFDAGSTRGNTPRAAKRGDWFTQDLCVITRNERGPAALQSAGKSRGARPNAGFRVEVPSGFSGLVRLTSLEHAIEAWRPGRLPAIWAWDDSRRPFPLVERDADLPPVCVIEVVGATSECVISPAAPLIVDLATPWEAGSAIELVGVAPTPDARAGQAFPSAGGGTRLVIERLPRVPAGKPVMIVAGCGAAARSGA